jgi:phosphoglycerol transferase MdoB-like AlkP superfamily enzyme
VPIATPPDLSREVLRRFPSRIPEVLRLIRFKLKIGFYWIPQTLIWCIVLGTALASSSRAVARPRLAIAVAWTAALTLWFFVMSYSHPLLQAACLLLLPAALIARKVDASRIWMTAWLLGYLGMTVVTIAVQRYVRPYLPILFLLAVAAMPLFVSQLLSNVNREVESADAHG